MYVPCINNVQCMLVCIHTCMHACIHTYIHTFIHSYIQAWMHTCMHTYICMCVKHHGLYTIYKYMHVYIKCVCVCEMHAHLCAPPSASGNDCHNSNTKSITAKCESVISTIWKEHTKGNGCLLKQLLGDEKEHKKLWWCKSCSQEKHALTSCFKNILQTQIGMQWIVKNKHV